MAHWPQTEHALHRLQAVQKLTERLDSAESKPLEAEAARNDQVASVVDQLLGFKQAQTAELGQRDAQVAALQGLVAQLQSQVTACTFCAALAGCAQDSVGRLE